MILSMVNTKFCLSSPTFRFLIPSVSYVQTLPMYWLEDTNPVACSYIMYHIHFPIQVYYLIYFNWMDGVQSFRLFQIISSMDSYVGIISSMKCPVISPIIYMYTAFVCIAVWWHYNSHKLKLTKPLYFK